MINRKINTILKKQSRVFDVHFRVKNRKLCPVSRRTKFEIFRGFSLAQRSNAS
jgi:hypothetical protein